MRFVTQLSNHRPHLLQSSGVPWCYLFLPQSCHKIKVRLKYGLIASVGPDSQRFRFSPPQQFSLLSGPCLLEWYLQDRTTHGRRGSNPQHPAWEIELSLLHFQHLQNHSEKINMHATHTVHALPDSPIAGGRLGYGLLPRARFINTPPSICLERLLVRVVRTP